MFTNPFGLGLILALPLLVLAYRKRKSAKTQIVSSLLILKTLAKKPVPKKKIKLPLRFYFEALALLALAIAAALPAFKPSGKKIAVIIDNSLSMSAKDTNKRSRLDLALETLKREQTSRDSYTLFETSPRLKETTENIEFSATPDDIERASSQLATKHDEIWIISDKKIKAENPETEQFKSFLVGTALTNIYIENTSLNKTLEGEEISVRVGLSGTKARQVDVAVSELDFSGNIIKKIGATTVNAAPGEIVAASFSNNQNALAYKIEITSPGFDAIEKDNTAWLVGDPEPSSQILLISDSADGLNKIPGFRINKISSEQFAEISSQENGEMGNKDNKYSDKYSLIIFHRSAPANAPNKPSLLILPPSNNAFFPTSDQQLLNISSWKETHPINSYLRVNLIKPSSGVEFKTPNWAEAVISGEKGSIIAAGQYHGALMAASGMELLPYEGKKTPALSILTVNLIKWLTNQQQIGADKLTGNIFPVSPEAKWLIVRPDKKIIELEPSSQERTIDLDLPGIYLFSKQGFGANALAVNCFHPKESDTNNIAELSLTTTQTKDSKGQSDWWKYLIVAAIIFLIIEMSIRRFEKLRFGPLAYIMRLVSFALLLFALSAPKTTTSTVSSKAVALFDISRSLSKEAKLQLASLLLNYAKESQSKIETFSFAESLSSSSIVVDPGKSAKQLLESLEGLLAEGNLKKSNIHNSLQQLATRTGAAAIFLFSDGWESQTETQNLTGFKIFPIVGDNELFLKKGVSISELVAPTTIKAGDKTKIDIVLRNNSESEQIETLAVKIDGELIKNKKITLAPASQKRISIKTSEIKGGKHKISAAILGDQAHRWVTAHEKSKILLLSGELDDERILSSLIRQKGYKLESIIADSPEELTAYSSIVLNNIGKTQLPDLFLAKLKQFVAQGGGLLTLGGNRSYGLGGYIDTELEQISPLKFTPPQTEKKRLINAIILVIDKSGSMAEQDKIISAKKAALSSIESLKDEDYISVIGFDFAPFVIIDLQKVALVKPQAETRLRNLTAVGKTNLLPALAAARQKLNNCPASRKHIIVLSDGKFPLESDLYVDEINKLRQGGISVSAVALGIEADVPFMKILARYGKGAFYQTIDPTRLPEIFVEDIKVAGEENSLNEQSNFPVAIGPAGLQSTSVEKYRPLRGFVETLPKQGSALELITKSKNQAFPILASWNFGAGKSIAFTSDANGRWSGPWLSWEKFSVFWGEIISKIQPSEKQQDFDFDFRHRVEAGKLKLDLTVFDLAQPSTITAEIISPDDAKKSLVFNQVAKGRYQAELDSPEEGDYFFNIKVDQIKLPEIGINLEPLGEFPGQGVNMEYLLKLSRQSGAELNPAKLLGKELRQVESKPLHLPLIILALLLLLIEAFVRESRTS